jgi:hypothetical protein
MSAVSSIVGGVLGAQAAGKAADVESSAAQKAQALSLSNQNAANSFQQGVLNTTTTAEQPYQDLGATSAGKLQSLVSSGFQAPTLADAENTPGYQFTLGQGTDAINRNAAANGTLLSGNTGKALTDYGQGLASTTYQNDYNNALNTYMSNYNTLQGATNTGLSSTGQLANAGQAAASNISNTDLTASQQQAQQLNNAAAARASGYLGAAKAYGTAAGGVAGLLGGGFGNLDSTGSSSGGEQGMNFLQGLI